MPPKALLDKSTSQRLAAAINDAGEGALSKGTKVWVRSDDGSAWMPGELRSSDGGKAQVLLESTGRSITCELSRVVPANPKLQEGIPDLTHLSYLNEPGILYNLRYRYGNNDIYTFAGPVLIALNPCKALPLYTTEVANAYKAGARDVVHSASMPPHIYLVAANAFRRMLRERSSQSLIVNGESGAGKTETTKKAMQYFATLAGGTGVEDQVLETNPILEAFGNAKTLRNHNSSRFGKLIQIHFNASHHICGACIRTYLLEKSRVVHQLKGERSYHIFYQLVRGAGKAQRQELRLPGHPTGFRFLAGSGCTDIEGVNDAAEFKSVCSALADVGIDSVQQASLFRLLAGILWLGNLDFAPDPTDVGNDAAMLVQNAASEAACELLGVTHGALGAALTRKRIVTPSEIITKLLNEEEARDCRDALAKALYAAAFDWIVSRINAKLDTGKKGSGLSISILDIYGFEQFVVNSFEQLCINYANERLQQQFTRHLFTLEQLEYEAEGIDWTKVEFIDNQECVDVIEQAPPKGLGVLSILDSQCRFPKATDDTFITTLKEALASHSHFALSARTPREFTVLHYAGAVSYDAAGFLDKNKDTLNADLVELMVSADPKSSPLVSALGVAIKEETDANAKRGGQTVGGRFSQQLRDLIAYLDTTGLHFVRCIKPNGALQPDHFEEAMVLHQLRCCGVLEVARIARAGFPTRYTHQAFAERYAILLPREQQEALKLAVTRNGSAKGMGNSGSLTPLSAASSGTGLEALGAAVEPCPDALAACRNLVDLFRLTPAQYQVGRTKIFFRPGVLGFVEDKWAAMQSAALRIQAAWRGYVKRIAFLRVRNAAVAFQSVWRGKQDRARFKSLIEQTRAAKVIQRQWRGYHARTSYLRTLRAVTTIQMAWRRSRFGKRVRRRVRDREKRELVARLEQDKFEAIRSQFGCDMEDVRAALAAWREAKERLEDEGKAAGGALTGASLTHHMLAAQRGVMQPGASAEAGTPVTPGMVAAAAEATAGTAIPAVNVPQASTAGTPRASTESLLQSSPSQTAAAASAAAALQQRRQSQPGEVLSPTSSLREPSSLLAADRQSFAARFAATQEIKEAAERLALENKRLEKQLQLERSLKERYQHKYEQQSISWKEQFEVLQAYIVALRTSIGDARLPPLPVALTTAPAIATPVTLPAAGGSSGGATADGTTVVSPFSAAAGTVPVPVRSEAGMQTDMDTYVTKEEAAAQVQATATQAAAAMQAATAAAAAREQSLQQQMTVLQRQLAAQAQSLSQTQAQLSQTQAQLQQAQAAAAQAQQAAAAAQAQAAAAALTSRSNGTARSGSPTRSGGYSNSQEILQASPSVPRPHPSARPSSPSNRGLSGSQMSSAGQAPMSPQRMGVTNNAAAKYVAQLNQELGNVSTVLEDDVDFLQEVRRGDVSPAPPDLDPAGELARLSKKFEIWKKEFQEKLRTAEMVLKKLDKLSVQQGYGGHRQGPMQAGATAHPGVYLHHTIVDPNDMQTSVSVVVPAPDTGGANGGRQGGRQAQPAGERGGGGLMGKLFSGR